VSAHPANARLRSATPRALRAVSCRGIRGEVLQRFSFFSAVTGAHRQVVIFRAIEAKAV